MTLPRVLVHCTFCRGPGRHQVTVLRVVDGPGVTYQEVRPEDARPSDVCGFCPNCGREKCVRTLTAAG